MTTKTCLISSGSLLAALVLVVGCAEDKGYSLTSLAPDSGGDVSGGGDGGTDAGGEDTGLPNDAAEDTPVSDDTGGPDVEPDAPVTDDTAPDAERDAPECDGESCASTETGIEAAEARLLGVTADDEAGGRVAGVGDVDGDGVPDLAVGACCDDEGDELRNNNSGAVYVIHLPVSGTRSLFASDATLLGESSVNYASFPAGAGDVDGDGVGDLLVGAPGAFAPMDADAGMGVELAGAAYLVLGPVQGVRMLEGADARFYGMDPNGGLGGALDGVGDLDGDGFDDIAIGGPRVDAGFTDNGALYLFYGPVTGRLTTDDADATIVGASGQARLGSSVSGVGDLNGDGRPDFMVGAPGDNEAYLFEGRRYSDTVEVTEAIATFTTESAAVHFGTSVANAGDLTGDGRPEVAIGNLGGPLWVFSEPFEGRVTDDPDRPGVFLVRGEAVKASFALGGDIDGDGIADIVSTEASVPVDTGIDGVRCFNASGVHVLAGPIFERFVEMDELPHWVIEGEDECDGTGKGLDLLGDFDLDGRDDFAVGAPFLSASEEYAGGAYVVRGRASF